ncbi:monovalent cation/H+ antiporter complex subunit F [Rhodovulum euryhalinum]|uniref:Multisubunit sodium/proton antiporter MrpF subunit n=1 Tax=Rhodovulum euryhalinum TaxID=35805 RepID=A0A4R2KNJ1_9RHOB|nr:monovalent cation/H+ antiporter complex subunit F [Rhodovulum euryhalinum]TCO74272.1 multisubunit sodium/proton antiporter MrpF subunit [Rhodovulum euryhalinum]
MSPVLAVILTVLLASLLGGLWRVIRGPSDSDRMLSAQLLGTAAVAMTVVLARLQDMPALLDVALVLALLAAVTLVAYVALSESRGR